MILQDTNLSLKDKSWLNLAMRLAGTSDLTFKHGCVIVKSGSVVGLSVNKARNMYVGGEVDDDAYTTHAEVNAIFDAGSNAHGAVLYVARVNKYGMPLMSYPCENCFSCAVQAGIKRIVFT